MDNDEESTMLIVLIPLLYCYPLLFKSLLYNHFAFTCFSQWKESQRGFSLLPKKKMKNDNNIQHLLCSQPPTTIIKVASNWKQLQWPHQPPREQQSASQQQTAVFELSVLYLSLFCALVSKVCPKVIVSSHHFRL